VRGAHNKEERDIHSGYEAGASNKMCALCKKEDAGVCTGEMSVVHERNEENVCGEGGRV
jgi:hypothetical protein